MPQAEEQLTSAMDHSHALELRIAQLEASLYDREQVSGRADYGTSGSWDVGIGAENENDEAWTAASVVGASSDQWEQCVTDEGVTYYYNHYTNESRWEQPWDEEGVQHNYNSSPAADAGESAALLGVDGFEMGGSALDESFSLADEAFVSAAEEGPTSGGSGFSDGTGH